MNYKYTKIPQDDIVLLQVSPFPDWQEFEGFVTEFIQQEQGQLVEQDYGMDRHQIRYQIGSSRWVLQFEHYSESIWIEQDY